MRKALLVASVGAGGLALSGCDVEPPAQGNIIGHLLGFGWPEPITPEGVAMSWFWEWIWVAAWIIGFIMWGLMIYSIFAFSAKKAEKAGKDPLPRQTGYNVPLEIVLTTVPIIIVMAIFFGTVQTQDQVTAMDKNPEVRVDVTAFQWNWKFGYGEVKGDLSPTGSDWDGADPVRTAAANDNRVPVGGAEHHGEGEGHDGYVAFGPIHGNSKSDISYLHFDQIETVGTTSEIPVLVLPSHTPIEFDLASADVSHAFWVPHFLFKRDAYPHPEANKSQRRFQIEEIFKEGAFVGRCAEMCGTYHAMMNFELRVVSRDKFTEYLKYRLDNPEAPNSEALKAIGEEPYATSTSPFVSGRLDTRGGENTVDLNETAR